ncbi:hypothetical protein GF386_03885 [Candidatus Pacearchaeota archaeon]|nr:hypothetical protein [Candidatus Pacearchaeota archaeon]MBD3283288.1 hypothetical protein [Candidatus Pacearchaeota archaeon]
MRYKIKLPRAWNKDLAYLFGLLLGDGSLPKTSSLRANGEYQKRHHIYFFSVFKDFHEEVYIPLFYSLFGISPRSDVQKNRDKMIYNCRIESQDIYEYLVMLGFSNGRKARLAKVPDIPKKYEVCVLAGLLDTDGGKKGHSFGFTTASKYLASFCKRIFDSFSIKYNYCPWIYNGWTYHQIYISRYDVCKLLKIVPLRNKHKISYLKSIASVA